MTPVQHIAVLGGSGSGKTWLAGHLCAAFGTQAVRLSLDHFYLDLSHLKPEARARVNFDDPAAIDWEAAREVLRDLSEGRTANIPAYDFATHTRLPGYQPLAPTGLVVWDGLWLLHPPWLREQFVYSVFVDCSVSERLARRIERDVRHRGRTEESVRQQFNQQVQPMHERFVEPQRELAHQCIVSPVSEDAWAELLHGVRTAVGSLDARTSPRL